MRKKLIALVILTVVLSTLLVGCSMFELDEERDYHRVVANVEYKGMTSEVYKGELLNLVAMYGPSYVQYYQWTYEQITEYFYNTLTKQKLMSLYAKEYIAKNGVGINAIQDDAAIAKLKSEDFLTVDERRHCIEMANKSFKENLDKLIKDREDEQKANEDDGKEDGEDETAKDDELAARPVRPKTEEKDEYVNKNVTDPSLLPKSLLDTYKNDILQETDKEKKKTMKYALNKLNDNIKSQYMTFDKYVEQQYEARIVEKFEEANGKSVVVSQEDIDKSVKKLQQVDINKELKEEDYAKAIAEDNAFLYHHTEKGYFNIRSILLKFSDEQTSALKNFTEINVGNDELIAQFKENLALGLETNQFVDTGIKVNVSNPKYDESKDELKDAYTDKDIDWKVIIYAMTEDMAKKVKLVEDFLVNKNEYTDLQKQLIIQKAKKLAFDDWMYLVNDDSGMFTKPSYNITREGQASSYVGEYTAFARELFKQNGRKSVGYTTLSSDKYLEVKNGDLEYAGTTEILKSAIGGKYKLEKLPLKGQKDENGKVIESTAYNFITTNNNALSFVVNQFGIHIVMIESIPVNEQLGTVVEEEKGGWTLQSDYIVNQDITINFAKDDKGNNKLEIESIKAEFKTLAESEKKKIEDQRIADKSTVTQLDLFNKNYIAKVEKIYKEIMKEINKQTK